MYLAIYLVRSAHIWLKWADEIRTAKFEKMFLRFSKPPNWYVTQCTNLADKINFIFLDLGLRLPSGVNATNLHNLVNR